jgi:hypothetical protein
LPTIDTVHVKRLDAEIIADLVEGLLCKQAASLVILKQHGPWILLYIVGGADDRHNRLMIIGEKKE